MFKIMKRTPGLITNKLLFLFSALFFVSISVAQDAIFNQGDWYKFSIDKSGVYKLDYNFLKNELGIPEGNLNTANIGICGYGGGVLHEYDIRTNRELKENNIEIVDFDNNGRIDESDYILFYGDGPYRIDLNSSLGLYSHTSAYYTDVQHFFLTTSDGTAKSLVPVSPAGSSVATLNSYDYIGIYDKDSLNPNLSGRVWYSSSINSFRRSIEADLPLEQCTPGENIFVEYSYFTKLNGAVLSVSTIKFRCMVEAFPQGSTTVHVLKIV